MEFYGYTIKRNSIIPNSPYKWMATIHEKGNGVHSHLTKTFFGILFYLIKKKIKNVFLKWQ